MTGAAIPSFYLYGEPHRAVQDDFIHVEQLDDRSRPSEWTIQPHAHADLAQVFVIETGGGTMQADDRSLAFRAPTVLVIPAGVVHGFRWRDESAGAVVTLAQSYLTQIVARHPDLGAVFAAPRGSALDHEALAALLREATGLQRELGWAAPGHHAAVEAGLLSLLVKVTRHLAPGGGDVPVVPGQKAALVARFRQLIEQRYRLRESVADHAAALGTSETSLRSACARIAGRAPAAMLDERAMIEAQRALRYTNLSVAEIGYALGFADPAYFSRFFARHAGRSPRELRNERR